MGTWIIVGVGVWMVGSYLISAKAARTREANYKAALAALAADPTNNQARVVALEWGRAYYGGLRKGGAPTIYDEQAINNDIMARSGAPR